MATLIINSVTFSGLPNGTGNTSAWQPDSYAVETARIGVTLVAANGTRNRVERGTIKRVWTLGWKACNAATAQTILTLCAVATTFSMTAYDGVSYTCQTEETPDLAWAYNDRTGASFWSVTVKVYQQ